MIDILYVNYNSLKVIRNSINSIFKIKTNLTIKIFVWDNNSDEDVNIIKKEFPFVKLFKSNKNIGFARGINNLLSHSDSPYIVFINPDTLIKDNFFEDIIEYLNNNHDVGILGPKILNPDGTIQGSARRFPDPLTSLFGRSSPLTKLFPKNSITAKNILTTNSKIDFPTEVDWVSGACMFVRRNVIQSVGGFDERFFLYWEDADLCRRIKQNGWKVIYYPDAQVIHCVGESSNTRPIFANYQFHKSCYRLYDKYAKWPFSAITPIAGIALMLRFLVAVIFNILHRIYFNIVFKRKKEKKIQLGRCQKIRVLRVISRMNIGGPSIHVKNLIENLNANKYESKLITGTVSPSEGDMGYIANFNKGVRISIPELQREISLQKDFIAFIKLLRVIMRFKPDIIHSHTSKAGTISRIAVVFHNFLKSKKIIVFHTFHGNVLDGYFNWFKTHIFLIIERILATTTDRIITISESQKWELSKVYKVARKNRIETIKLGFDLNPFLNCHKSKGFIRNKIGVSQDTIIIGIVGRMVPIKNHKMFIESASILLSNNKQLKIKFLLVGDGELRTALENHAIAAGIDDHMVFYGWEKRISIIYADLDILALTSLNEGTPVSIIEAMAAKVPVITTGVGGIKDLLGGFDSYQPNPMVFKICRRGILCPKDNPHAFYAALKYMIESGYLCDNLRFSRAQDYVVNNYSVDRLVKDMESLYEHFVSMK